MQPEKILGSDLLDILFENRNKKYGAYELRRNYDARVKKAIAITLILVSSILLLLFFLKKAPKTNPDQPWLSSTVILNSTPPEHKKPDLPKQIKNNSTAKPVQHVASATLPNKPVIVQDDQADKILDKPNPVDQKDNSIINATVNDNPGSQNTGTINRGTGGDVSNGPSVDNGVDPNTPIAHPDELPQFPGGLSALSQFLKIHLVVPDNMDEDQKIDVQIQFVVNSDGSIAGYNVLKSGGDDFDNEVIRVLKMMPHWKPGKFHGKPVSTYFIVPVKFQMDSYGN